MKIIKDFLAAHPNVRTTLIALVIALTGAIVERITALLESGIEPVLLP